MYSPDIEKDSQIKNFILSNPYPEYDEIDVSLFHRVDLYVEYGMLNHYCCKKIYENLDNPSIIKEMTYKIYKAGGVTALKANLETIKLFSPINKNKKEPYYDIINERFDSIFIYIFLFYRDLLNRY